MSSCGQQKVRWPPPGAGIAQTSFFSTSSSRAKTLKPEPRKCSEHVLHDKRVAQVRLVGAVFAHRFGIGNARPGLGRDRLAARRTLRTCPVSPAPSPRKHRLARRSSFRGRAGRIRPAGGRRAGPRRESRARSGNSGRSPPSSEAACTAAAPAAARRICRDGCATARGNRARLQGSTR